MNAKAVAEPPVAGHSVALWAGVLGAPVMWGLQLQLGYSFVPWVCKHGHYLVLHLITLVFFTLTIIGGLLSWRDYRHAGGGNPETPAGGPIARDKFLGGLGMALSALFAIAILAQGLASFFLNACWD